MTMSATYEDQLAAWRLLGQRGPKPEDPAEAKRRAKRAQDARVAAVESLRAEAALASPFTGNVAKRAMRVLSSDGHTYYTVEERPDTVHGGTYVFCSCVAWAFQRGKGRDCKHVLKAKAIWSR